MYSSLIERFDERICNHEDVECVQSPCCREEAHMVVVKSMKYCGIIVCVEALDRLSYIDDCIAT